MKGYLWSCLLVLICVVAKAQLSHSLYKALPDTLRPKNKLALTDEERIKLINETDQPLQLHYHEDFQAITSQLEMHIGSVQDKVEKIPYANSIASFYMSTDEREKYFLWEKKLAAYGEGATKYQSYICWAYTNMSLIYSASGRQDSAIALLHKGLDIANQNTNGEKLQYILYYGYIQVYRHLNLYSTALDYINKYLKAVPDKDKWNDGYTEIVMNKASVYANLFRNENKAAYADSVKTVVQQTMLIKKKDAAYWYFLCYFYLGFLEYYSQHYPEAIRYFDLALSPVYRDMQGYRFYLPQLYKNASLIALGRQEGVQGLLGVSIPTNDFQAHKEADRVLSHYYTQHKNYQKALAHYTQYRAWADSIDVIGQRGRVFEAEQKYSVAQKEADIAQLETKNLQAQTTRNTIVAASVSVILLLILLFYLRNKRLQAQRLAERHKLSDELHKLEDEMNVKSAQVQVENAMAMLEQRKLISQNMHDEVSTSLVTLQYYVADLKLRAKDKDVSKILDDIEQETHQVYVQAREFMHQLYNSAIQIQYNVVDFLRSLSLRFSEGSILQVVTDVDEEAIQRYFTPLHHNELYRVIKEAVTNSMKHAGATQLTIHVQFRNGVFYFSIADNGKGFTSSNSSGMGMKNLSERIALLNGTLHLKSTDAGTELSGSFPAVGVS